MKRNTNLSLRTQESTSIARASIVLVSKHFFSELAEVMDRCNLQGSDMWNMDFMLFYFYLKLQDT